VQLRAGCRLALLAVAHLGDGLGELRKGARERLGEAVVIGLRRFVSLWGTTAATTPLTSSAIVIDAICWLSATRRLMKVRVCASGLRPWSIMPITSSGTMAVSSDDEPVAETLPSAATTELLEDRARVSRLAAVEQHASCGAGRLRTAEQRQPASSCSRQAARLGLSSTS
jgi:hypothetical protein